MFVVYIKFKNAKSLLTALNISSSPGYESILEQFSNGRGDVFCLRLQIHEKGFLKGRSGIYVSILCRAFRLSQLEAFITDHLRMYITIPFSRAVSFKHMHFNIDMKA